MGTGYTWDHGQFDRKDTSYTHSSAILSSEVVCAPEDPACVSGEQYFERRNVYLSQDQDADINSFAAYLEDLIRFGPVELRLGGRISHDDFMDNTNVAYRSAGSWDILKNGKTLLIGGYNRYYGEALLTYKLREAIVPFYREARTLDPVSKELSEWSFDRSYTLTLDKYSGLDTPYSDEWTIGVAQQIMGGTLELNYLERKNRDQFAKEKITEVINGDNANFYVLNNNGSSDYESIKVSWDQQWMNHYLNVNYTYSDQDSSNESYDDTFDEDDLMEEVWYDGKIVESDELPRLDYNRKHMVNIIYTGRLPWDLTFTNVTRYFGEYDDLGKLTTAEKKELGIPTDLTAYEDVTRPDYWIFDWRLDWEKETYRGQSMIVSLEVNNVFDRTPPAGASDDSYELGRQFWLGMTYQF